MATEQDLWERGFQLAYFLYPERETAVRILSGALNKLRLQRGRETRRSYWRDKHLKRGITRITRDEGDALQWLIFSESDAAEKEQEQADATTSEHMVVRYIKNLVRMTTSMSSFYVNIGLHRLLFSYSTSETQRLYESVTERFLGADEYRRAKSALMRKLLKRFATLKTCRTQHGELRFETFANEEQEIWTRLVDTCLKAFTPWSTLQACPVPVDYNASRDRLPARLSGSGERVDFNQVEINRCHAFIDPVCDSRLMEALLLQPPMKKLALPRFYMENQHSENDPTYHGPAHHDPDGTSGLTPGERDNISQQLSRQASRRKQADPQSIIIVVDGEERAQLRLDTATSQSITLEEGDQLIEVRTQISGEGEDLLLAVHTLAYTESRGFAAAELALWRGISCNLDLVVVPGANVPEAQLGEEPGHAAATFRVRPRPFRWARKAFSPEQRTGFRFPQAALTFAALAIAVIAVRIAIVRQHEYRPGPAAVSKNSPSPTAAPNPGSPQTPNQTANQASNQTPLQIEAAELAYRLVPDELATRGSGEAKPSIIALPKHVSKIDLELPVLSEYAGKNLRATLKLFFQPGEILSTNNLRAHRTNNPAKNSLVVSFAIPSEKLRPGQEYAVELQAANANGKMETVESYGFRVK